MRLLLCFTLLSCSSVDKLSREDRAVIVVRSVETVCNEFAPGSYPKHLPELGVVCEALKVANAPKLEQAAGAPPL
jgi:hypothetical protein